MVINSCSKCSFVLKVTTVKNTLEVCEQCIVQYGPLGLKHHRTTKNIKPVDLASDELHWSEGIGEAVNRKLLKFCGNFLKAF